MRKIKIGKARLSFIKIWYDSLNKKQSCDRNHFRICNLVFISQKERCYNTYTLGIRNLGYFLLFISK